MDLYYKAKIITTDEYEKLLEFSLVLTTRDLYQFGIAIYNSLDSDIANISKELTKVLIPKYFDLDNPNNWVSKDEW